MDDLARLRAVTTKTRAVIHSQLRGASMGAAIPDGARIRIRCGPESSWGGGEGHRLPRRQPRHGPPDRL